MKNKRDQSILGYTKTTKAFVWLFDVKAVDVFMGSKMKVTSEGKRHLGAVIGSEAFKVSYAKSLVDN